MKQSLSWLALLVLAGCASAPKGGDANSAGSLGGLFSSGPKLAGTRWVWVETATPSARLPAPKSGLYLLDFNAERFVRVTADCNRGSAPYQLSGNDFKAGPLALTRMACAPGGQAARFGADLQKAERAELTGGDLLLGLANGGSMRFSPMQTTRYLCANKLKFGLTDLPGKEVAIEFDGRYFRAAPVTVGSGVAYEGQGVRFHGKGDEAMLDLGEQSLRNCKAQTKP